MWSVSPDWLFCLLLRKRCLTNGFGVWLCASAELFESGVAVLRSPCASLYQLRHLKLDHKSWGLIPPAGTILLPASSLMRDGRRLLRFFPKRLSIFLIESPAIVFFMLRGSIMHMSMQTNLMFATISQPNLILDGEIVTDAMMKFQASGRLINSISLPTGKTVLMAAVNPVATMQSQQARLPSNRNPLLLRGRFSPPPLFYVQTTSFTRFAISQVLLIRSCYSQSIFGAV